MKDYPKFHHARVKHILAHDFNCRLELIPTGYKANRVPGFHVTYKLIDNSTNEVIASPVSLDALSKVLFIRGYSPINNSRRNPGAKQFLKFVEEYKAQHRESGDSPK